MQNIPHPDQSDCCFCYYYSGTTATVILMKEKEIMAAWVGDSTAVICRNVNGRPCGQLLTVDHKPTDPAVSP